MSWRDIKPILEALGGPPAPPEWKGALPIEYRLGGEARVHLKVDMPGLIHLYRVEPESDPQVGSLQRLAQQAVGRHSADDTNEVRSGLVDDALDLRRHRHRQIPGLDPLSQSGRDRRIDAEADDDQRALGCGERVAQPCRLRRRVAGRPLQAGHRAACGRGFNHRLHCFSSGQRQIGNAKRPLPGCRQRPRHNALDIGRRHRVHVAAERPIHFMQRQ